MRYNIPMNPRILLAILFIPILAACVAPTGEHTPTANPTADRQPPTADAPTPIPPIPISPVPSSPTPLPPDPLPTPTPSVIHDTLYTLDVTLDYNAHTLAVSEAISYTNATTHTLDTLLLVVEANLWPNCFTLAALNADGIPITNYTLAGQRLEFALPAQLAPSAVTTLTMQYSLALPFAAQSDPDMERPRIFGYTDRQVNLTNWYPFVAPYLPGQGWVLHDPWYYGEHLVYEAADYTVYLKTINPAQGLVVASSGWAEPDGERTRYTLTAGRAFVFSVSPEFEVASIQAGDVIIYSYFFPTFDAYKKGGQDVLMTSAQSIELFTQRYGPYPHRTLSAVMGDFNDGMEYSAFYFMPRDFYNSSQDSPKNYLTFVASHETAHQWWFETVANDQAMEPWLDEALCTYSERLYYEAYYPDLLAWWWPYRMYYYNPQAKMDIPIYEGGGFQPYTNAVYFRGAYFIEALRARLGDAAFFAFLQDYAETYAGRQVTAADFFAILKEHSSADISDLLVEYFLP